MTKQLVVFITSLTVLVFIAGCPPVKPEPAKPTQLEPTEAEPNEVEPAKTEPNEAEPVKTEPNEVEPAKTEPNEIEPTEAEPNEIEPAKTEPNEVEPSEVEPNEAEPTKAEPNELEPTKPEPNEVEPIKVEPNEVKPRPKVTFHDKCAGILNSFVDDKGMVNYRKLKQKKSKLKQLLDEFAKLSRNEYDSWPKEDKIAFWINAYNIKMLKIIVDNYPIESSRILRVLWGPDSRRHINKRIGGINNQKFYVMEEEFTLQKVEDRFFRKEFDEPRVFFALCYATLSSPPLRNEPYRGTKLSQQLDDQAKKFLSNPLAFKINKKKRIVHLSYILQPTWFGREFIQKYGTNKKFKDQQPAVRAVLNCLTNYISEQDTNYLKVENYSIQYMRPNWRLNDSSQSMNYKL